MPNLVKFYGQDKWTHFTVQGLNDSYPKRFFYKHLLNLNKSAKTRSVSKIYLFNAFNIFM